MGEPTGRTALVTGASRGIGRGRRTAPGAEGAYVAALEGDSTEAENLNRQALERLDARWVTSIDNRVRTLAGPARVAEAHGDRPTARLRYRQAAEAATVPGTSAPAVLHLLGLPEPAREAVHRARTPHEHHCRTRPASLPHGGAGTTPVHAPDPWPPSPRPGDARCTGRNTGPDPQSENPPRGEGHACRTG
ncbi:hypothetical protein [Streptomyces sp. NPDC002619]|uniref:hypothetical protein n=1 Tax=Streptomyces sp. NPDC002619 TaxID=3364655 RepID=UPI00369B368F